MRNKMKNNEKECNKNAVRQFIANQMLVMPIDSWDDHGSPDDLVGFASAASAAAASASFMDLTRW
jgi:hypothetical protein